jgi:hypothetical protein
MVQEVKLPSQAGVSKYDLLWNSAFDEPADEIDTLLPEAITLLSGTSIQVFRCQF